MLPPVISLQEKFDCFTDQWAPRIVAQMNDYHFKIARVEGEFVWHKHDATDEVFFVVAGQLTIDFRDGSVTASQGEMVVVPAGVEHKPRASSECRIMLVEPAGTFNTGDADPGGKTSTDGEWI